MIFNKEVIFWSKRLHRIFYPSLLTLGVAFVFLFLSINVNAQFNNIKFRRIGAKEGLSSGFVTCIYQDNQGYIWFGTRNGLNKFNGYEITNYKANPKDSSSLSSNYILSIAQDDKGYLWVGTDDGGLNQLNVITGKVEAHYRVQSGNVLALPSDKVFSLLFDSKKRLWVGTFGGGLSLFDNQKKSFISYRKVDGDPSSISNNNVYKIIEEAKTGHLLIGTLGGGLNKFDPESKKFTYWMSGTNNDGPINNDIYDIFQDNLGDIWLACFGGGLSKFEVKKKSFVNYIPDAEHGSLNSAYIVSVTRDVLGNVWVGTREGGLNRLSPNGNTFKTYRHDRIDLTSLPKNDINQLFIDRAGTMWIATDGEGVASFETRVAQFSTIENQNEGSNRFRASSVNAIVTDNLGYLWVGTFEDGLYKVNTANETFVVYKDELKTNKSTDDYFDLGLISGLTQGNDNANQVVSISALAFDNKRNLLWIGTAENGLFKYNTLTNQFTQYQENATEAIGLSSNAIEALIIDSEGKLWIGTYGGGVCVFNYENNTFEYYNTESQPAVQSNAIECLFEDKKGNIWIGSKDKGLAVFNPKTNTVKIYESQANDSAGLASNYITAIAEDNLGNIWVGTLGKGVEKLDPQKNKIEHITQRDGISGDDICGIIVEPKNGTIWISTTKGLTSYENKKRIIRNFGLSDGLLNPEFIQGAYHASIAGEFFFGGLGNLVHFRPNNMVKRNYAPPVHISAFKKYDNLVLFDRPIEKLDEISLREFTDDFFSFDYVYLNYDNAERNVYRVMLEGYDRDWRLVGNLRTIPYTKIGQGEYRFRVQATDRSGDFSKASEASVKIVIYPPWWNTWWAKSIGILIIVGAGIGYYRNRIKQIERQKVVLQNLVDERTAELREEKNKSDNLLLNILPVETATELKEKGAATPRYYQKVSVLFTDFKGFTNIAERLSPSELIAELDNCFLRFDEIIGKHNMEKIKTIGDAYMCAGGIPIANITNPIDAVMAGLAIQRVMDEIRVEKEAEGKRYWQLRIGIHTGDLVAGVVGKKKFAYDIWGDAVNTASRMESSGEPNRVNISGNTYELVKDFFECEYRGKIYAKNKGEIDMYFVLGIKPELSMEGKGVEPNLLFNNNINRLISNQQS